MNDQNDVIDIAEHARTGTLVPAHSQHFRIRIDEDAFQLSTPHPTGRQLLALAGKDPDSHFLTQVLIGEDDQVIEPDETANLLRPGTERFTVVAKPVEDCHDDLFIFVNRQRKTRHDGVKRKMTGAEIAALVSVPSDNAVVKRDDDSHTEIGIGETVTICEGQHFFVTRDKVTGGHE